MDNTQFSANYSTNSFLEPDQLIALRDINLNPFKSIDAKVYGKVSSFGLVGNKNIEMKSQTQALLQLKSEVLLKAKRQATELGIHGLVGIKMHTEVEGALFGYDVFVSLRATGVKCCNNKTMKLPVGVFTTDLCPIQLRSLLFAGYRPVDYLQHLSIYHVARRKLTSVISSAMKNVELENYTQAMYDARHMVMNAMKNRAKGSSGIIGVNIHENAFAAHSHIITFRATGTSIEPVKSEHLPLSPKVLLSV